MTTAETTRPTVGYALASGLAGALVLNVVHETLRHTVPHAPRVQKLGERGIARIMRAAGANPPANTDELYWPALAGDVASNTAYYALVGLADGHNAVPVGTGLGLLAGVGALVLPGPMGLGQAPTNRTTATQLMTVGLYTLGGWVAGATFRWLRQHRTATT